MTYFQSLFAQNKIANYYNNERKIKMKAKGRVETIIIVLLIIFIFLSNGQVFASDNGANMRAKSVPRIQKDFYKQFRFSPIVKVGGKDNVILFIESFRLNLTLGVMMLDTSEQGTLCTRQSALKKMGFKKVYFIKQQYNANEFNGWIWDLELEKLHLDE